MFASTMAVGLFVAYRYLSAESGSPVVQIPSFSLSDIIYFLIIVVFILLAMRSGRLAKIVLWLFLIIMVFSGAEIVFGLYLPFPWEVVASLVLLAVFFILRNVFIHDVAVILALAGIGGILGMSITPSLGVAVLIALSFYDIIAVYKTRHMVRMAQGMISSGAIFGFIIPQENKSFFEKKHHAQAQIGEQFMVLGSGDIGLPLVFASSLVRQSLSEAIFVGAFSVLGVFLTHLLFTNQTKRQAMAALPPIATMCLIGYLIALLLNL